MVIKQALYAVSGHYHLSRDHHTITDLSDGQHWYYDNPSDARADFYALSGKEV